MLLILKCVYELLFYLPKNYQNSLPRALLRRKKLHWSRLIWPTRYTCHTQVTSSDLEGLNDSKHPAVSLRQPSFLLNSLHYTLIVLHCVALCRACLFGVN